MSSPNTFALTANPTTYTDSWGGRLVRDMDEAVERSMARVLSSEVINDNQRATAWEKFYQADWVQKMAWASKVGTYVREVMSGKRPPRPEVAPAVAEEVQQLEIAAQQVQQQVEQHAAQVEEVMEQVAEVVAEVVAARQTGEVPMWVSREAVEELPAGLQWSGRQLPAVGGSVRVMRRGRARQVKVVGYFHAEGFLGIEVEFEGRVPNVLRTSPRSQCFFGSEVRPEAVAA